MGDYCDNNGVGRNHTPGGLYRVAERLDTNIHITRRQQRRLAQQRRIRKALGELYPTCEPALFLRLYGELSNNPMFVER